MIKDIGTEGLKVVDVVLPNHIRDTFSKGQSVFVLAEGCDMVDVTTLVDTERKYMQCLTGNQGTY